MRGIWRRRDLIVLIIYRLILLFYFFVSLTHTCGSIQPEWSTSDQPALRVDDFFLFSFSFVISASFCRGSYWLPFLRSALHFCAYLSFKDSHIACAQDSESSHSSHSPSLSLRRLCNTYTSSLQDKHYHVLKKRDESRTLIPSPFTVQRLLNEMIKEWMDK